MKRIVLFLLPITFHASLLWGQEATKAVEVFPSTPFSQYIIYETLVIFWIAIVGLLVIIRMKLREIERVQKVGLDRENNAAGACHHIHTNAGYAMDNNMDNNNEQF